MAKRRSRKERARLKEEKLKGQTQPIKKKDFADLNEQFGSILNSKRNFGVSKYAQRKAGVDTSQFIYSFKTLETYQKQARIYANWCEAHGYLSFEESRNHVNDYLKAGIERGLSSPTLKTQKAALAKLYSCSATEFIETPQRKRSAITRSREATENQKHFSDTNNANLISFCRSTGLRRHELAGLRGSQLKELDGVWYLTDVKGKGGKRRKIEVCGNIELVKKICKKAGNALVIRQLNRTGKIPVHADIHGYRREYVTALYLQKRRENVPKEDRYYCRGDLAGVYYDRKAMIEVSLNVGHNRESVIAANYLDPNAGYKSGR